MCAAPPAVRLLSHRAEITPGAWSHPDSWVRTAPDLARGRGSPGLHRAACRGRGAPPATLALLVISSPGSWCSRGFLVTAPRGLDTGFVLLLPQRPPRWLLPVPTGQLPRGSGLGLRAPRGSPRREEFYVAVFSLQVKESTGLTALQQKSYDLFLLFPIPATQRLCLLLFPCLLSLAASLPAFHIENAFLLNGTLDAVMNIPPESPQPGKCTTTMGWGQTRSRSARPHADHLTPPCHAGGGKD